MKSMTSFYRNVKGSKMIDLVQQDSDYTLTPDTTYNAKELFGLDIDWDIPAFFKAHGNVPEIDPTYQFYRMYPMYLN